MSLVLGFVCVNPLVRFIMRTRGVEASLLFVFGVYVIQSPFAWAFSRACGSSTLPRKLRSKATIFDFGTCCDKCVCVISLTTSLAESAT